MEIILITQDNLHKYSFLDLVAPLFGFSIDLPENSIMNGYLREELVKLDLEKCDFQEKAKSLCFKGAFRKCVIKPPKIEFEIISHK